LPLDFRYSRMTACWLLLTHGLPLLVLPLLQLTFWLNLAITGVSAASLIRTWRLHVNRRQTGAVQSACWEASGELTLQLAGSKQQTVQLAPQALILPWLVVIYFDSSWPWRGSLPISRDMLDAGTFRRLRVRLRIAMDTAGT